MWEWNAKSQFFKTKLAGDLALRLDWVMSSSCELTEWPIWTFCLVVLQLAWRFSFFACFTYVHPLAACQLQATHKIQSQVPASMHSLEHFFTLSHTLPLHDSHPNTGFLSAELQANWHRIKPTKWLIKFNRTVYMNCTNIISNGLEMLFIHVISNFNFGFDKYTLKFPPWYFCASQFWALWNFSHFKCKRTTPQIILTTP